MKKWPLLDKVIVWLRNKYILSILIFIVWMIFFDRNDLISQYSYRQQLNKLQEDKEFYLKEIERNQKDLYYLMSDPANREKYAREQYLMKKDDEELFLIIKKPAEELAEK
jgi:hypothetical protein